jgi:poly(3-hydroxybutyrate) depolymerase
VKPNSFTGRGITSAVMDQDVLGRLNQIIDAYRALDLLSKHPRIDPDRVALVGTSRGGQSALYASMKRFKRLHGGAELASSPLILPSRPIAASHIGVMQTSPLGPCVCCTVPLTIGTRQNHAVPYLNASL